MKHLSLITLATTTLLLFTITTNGNTLVYDTYGEPLIPGDEYYVVPYNYAEVGGGFSWKENKKLFSPCPELYINQVEDNTDVGQTTTFYPTKGRQNKITLSTDINIIFPQLSPPASLPFFCPPTSNVWKVDDDGKQVLLGGKKGARDSKSVFSIEELEDGGYAIYYCTGVSGCSGLGVDPSSDDRRLVVNGTKPVAVVFESEKYFLRKYARSYAV